MNVKGLCMDALYMQMFTHAAAELTCSREVVVADGGVGVGVDIGCSSSPIEICEKKQRRSSVCRRAMDNELTPGHSERGHGGHLYAWIEHSAGIGFGEALVVGEPSPYVLELEWLEPWRMHCFLPPLSYA